MFEEKIIWHEIKIRPATDEEGKRYSWLYILDCPLPDEGETILIETKKGVQVDAFYEDGECYLDSGVDWCDVLAWAEMPKGIKKGSGGNK